MCQGQTLIFNCRNYVSLLNFATTVTFSQAHTVSTIMSKATHFFIFTLMLITVVLQVATRF